MTKGATPERDTQVLLVIGSVSDEYLDIGRDAITAGGCKTKPVRMSRKRFIDKFVPALRDLGVYRLDEIVNHAKCQGRPAPTEFKGIATPNGFIGAVMMDRRTWNQLIVRDVFPEDTPIWAMSKNGREIELMEIPEETTAA